MQCGWSNNNMETNISAKISKQVNVMVDACYKSKNLSIKICQKMNNSAFSFSISMKHEHEKKEKKSITKEERGKKKKNMD